MDSTNIPMISIIALTVSIISFFTSFYVVSLRRSTLEVTLYKSTSDAIKNFLDFSSKEYTYETEEGKELFKKIKNKFKIEVLNNLEYACKKYLAGQIDSESFEEYYKDIIIRWAAQGKILIDEKSGVFQNIYIVERIFKRVESKPCSFCKSAKFLSKNNIFWIIVLVYLFLLHIYAWPCS